MPARSFAIFAVAMTAFVVVAVPLLAAATPPPNCNDGVGEYQKPYGVCILFRTSSVQQFLPQPVLPDTSPCPYGFSGTNVSYYGDNGGLCYQAHLDGIRVNCNTANVDSCFGTSTTGCSRKVQTLDPGIYIAGNTVTGCIMLVSTAQRPFVFANLTGCPYGLQGVDPTVYLGNGSAQLCVSLFS
ncbi:MAG: hypothetical protein ACYDDF_01830 [Thermoplasmatota archaeon]